MDDFEKRTASVISWLQQEFTGIRTGQAAPAILDSIRVDSYGSKVPVNQVASIGIEDARTLRISPWDTDSIGAIETALREADLGVSVATDSAGLRVSFPELTSERRTQLIKLAGTKLEEARIRVRGARDDVMKGLDKQEKEGDLSKDEHFAAKEKVQKLVEATNAKLEELYKAKETEISR